MGLTEIYQSWRSDTNLPEQKNGFRKKVSTQQKLSLLYVLFFLLIIPLSVTAVFLPVKLSKRAQQVTTPPVPPITLTPAPAGFGQAVKISSASSFIKVSPSLTTLQQTAFTVEAWIKMSDNQPMNDTNPHYIIGKETANGEGPGYSLAVANRKAEFRIYLVRNNEPPANVVLSGKTKLNFNQWYHIAGIIRGPTVFIFVNGVVDAMVSIPQGNYGYERENRLLTIGCLQPLNFSACLGTFYGEIDEVRLSGNARLPSDSLPPNAPFVDDESTQALWHLDGNARDSSRNSNHGTVVGDTQFVPSTILIPTPTSSPIPTPIACVGEGGSIPVVPYEMRCCPGLVLCPPPPKMLGSRGTCLRSCPTISPSPTPPGCFYKEVLCIKAPCPSPILVCPTPTPQTGAYRLKLSNNQTNIICKVGDKNCYFETTVIAINQISKPLHRTTVYQKSPDNIMSFIGFNKSWTSGPSSSDVIIQPEQEAVNTQVKVIPRQVLGKSYAYFYVDGTTCNTKVNPSDCYYYGASSFTVVINVVSPSIVTPTPPPTSPTLKPTSTPTPYTFKTPTPTPTWIQKPTITPTPTSTLVRRSCQSCDFNQDGKVDSNDISFLSLCFGASKPNWKLIEGLSCQRADLNQDGKIDIADSNLFRFGEKDGCWQYYNQNCFVTKPTTTPTPTKALNRSPVISTYYLRPARLWENYQEVITGYDEDGTDQLQMQITGLPPGIYKRQCAVSTSSSYGFRNEIRCEISGRPYFLGNYKVTITLTDQKGGIAGKQLNLGVSLPFWPLR